MAGGRKLRVSCGPVATFNPSKQEAKGGSDEAQDSIVLSMSNELLYLVPELHTHRCGMQFERFYSLNDSVVSVDVVLMMSTGARGPVWVDREAQFAADAEEESTR